MLQVHTRLGDFEILALLGRGGMGEVYEARQFNPDRRVAVKVLAPWLANDDEALERFWREAAVPANLDHPGIVRIISTGKTADGIAYYAMHLVRGISLSEMIRRGNTSPQSDAVTKSLDGLNTPSMAPPATDEIPPPSPAPASALESSPQLMRDYRSDRFTALARIGALAARALAYAHQQGHLHRDIKPSNLMVDHHDQVFLVDFGLTRGLGPSGSGTSPGTVVGTPWYMSPEQADGKALDNRSDIYSLGVTLYELATQGLGPFTASRDDKKSVLAQVRAGTVLPLRTLAPGIPLELERIIQRAMHLKPHKRYVTAADLAHDLEAFLGHSHKPSGRPQLTSLPPERSRRRWPIWVSGAIALVAIVTVAALVYNPDRHPVDPNDNGADPAPRKRKMNHSKAWPKSLRDKGNLNSEVSLLDTNAKPIWCEQCLGAGKHSPLASQLSVSSDAMLALADPDTPNFEFQIELAQLRSEDDMGVFFGWQRRDEESNDPYQFFVLKWENWPVADDAHGRVTVGTAWVLKGDKIRTDSLVWLQHVRGDKATIPLTAKPEAFWPTLKVAVQAEQFTITVPNRVPVTYALADVKKSDPTKFRDLSTAGAVGVWTRQGMGLFKQAKIIPRQAE